MFQGNPAFTRNQTPLPQPQGSLWGATIATEFLNVFDPNSPDYLAGLEIQYPARAMRDGQGNFLGYGKSPLITGAQTVTNPNYPTVPEWGFSSNSGAFNVDFSVDDAATGGSDAGPYLSGAPASWFLPGKWYFAIVDGDLTAGISGGLANGSYTGSGLNQPPFIFFPNCTFNLYMISQVAGKVLLATAVMTYDGPTFFDPPGATNFNNTHSTVNVQTFFPYPFDSVAILGGAYLWSIYVEVVNFGADPRKDFNNGKYDLPLILQAFQLFTP